MVRNSYYWKRRLRWADRLRLGNRRNGHEASGLGVHLHSPAPLPVPRNPPRPDHLSALARADARPRRHRCRPPYDPQAARPRRDRCARRRVGCATGVARCALWRGQTEAGHGPAVLPSSKGESSKSMRAVPAAWTDPAFLRAVRDPRRVHQRCHSRDRASLLRVRYR